MTHPLQPSFTRRATTFLIGNWASRIYLSAVMAATLFLLWDSLITDPQGPSFAGIYLVGLTAPVSVALVPLFVLDLGRATQPVFVAAAIGGALLNIMLLNAIVASVRQLRTPRPAR